MAHVCDAVFVRQRGEMIECCKKLVGQRAPANSSATAIGLLEHWVDIVER